MSISFLSSQLTGLRELVDAMKAVSSSIPEGDELVIISFNGSGDSGDANVERLSAVVDGMIEGMVSDLAIPVEEWLLNLAHDVLPSGWEINEGSDGTIEIDFRQGTIILTFNENIITQRTSTTEL
jgi:hypothetical protein